jgi:hypothetical protein
MDQLTGLVRPFKDMSRIYYPFSFLVLCNGQRWLILLLQ